MKSAKYTCNHCGELIHSYGDNSFTGSTKSDGGSYQIDYSGIEGASIMGDNRWPRHGFHYHPDCFSALTALIVKFNKPATP